MPVTRETLDKQLEAIWSAVAEVESRAGLRCSTLRSRIDDLHTFACETLTQGPVAQPIPVAIAAQLRVLGSDWTAKQNAVIKSCWDVRHNGGLWVCMPEGWTTDDTLLQAIADKLLDAVVDGVKGQVDVSSMRDGGKYVITVTERTPPKR